MLGDTACLTTLNMRHMTATHDGLAGLVHIYHNWPRANPTCCACLTSLRLSWDQTHIEHKTLQTLGVETNTITQLSGLTCTNSVVRSAVTLLLCSSRRSCFRVAFLPTMEENQCTRPCSFMLSFTIWVTKANSPPGQTISSGVPAQRHAQCFLGDVSARQLSIGKALWYIVLYRSGIRFSNMIKEARLMLHDYACCSCVRLQYAQHGHAMMVLILKAEEPQGLGNSLRMLSRTCAQAQQQQEAQLAGCCHVR